MHHNDLQWRAKIQFKTSGVCLECFLYQTLSGSSFEDCGKMSICQSVGCPSVKAVFRHVRNSCSRLSHLFMQTGHGSVASPTWCSCILLQLLKLLAEKVSREQMIRLDSTYTTLHWSWILQASSDHLSKKCPVTSAIHGDYHTSLCRLAAEALLLPLGVLASSYSL